MGKRILYFLAYLLVAINVWMTAAVPSALAAQSAKERCENFLANFDIGGDSSANPFRWVNPDRFCTIQGFLYWLLQMALGLAGMIAVVFVVIGGYMYMTAAGNDEQAEKGRKTLTNAVIGLVVIIMSVVIIRVVVNTITKDSPNSGNTPAAQTGSPGDNGQPNMPAGGLPQVGAMTFSGDSRANINEIYNFTITVPKDLAASLCKTATPSFYGTVADAQGQTRKLQPSVQDNGDSYVLSLSTKPSSLGFEDKPNNLSDKNLVMGASVCGQQAGDDWEVPIYYTVASASPRGSEGNSAKIAEAAARANFTLTTSKDKKNIRINIDALSSDKMTLCGISSFSRLSEGKIEAFLNGQSVGQTYASDTILNIDLKSPVQYPSIVRVDICGHTIGGGDKAVPSPSN